MLEDALITLISGHLKPDNSELLRTTLGYEEYLRAYRTIGLLAPRRSGKTALCVSLAKNYSFLLVARHLGRPSGAISPDLVHKPEEYLQRFRGMPRGPKYRGIILDEVCPTDVPVYTFASLLRVERLLEEDPMIISLYTPTK